MGIVITVISVVFFLLCVLLIILILLQSDKSAGMGILGGSSQSAFGSSTADVITKATGVMIGLFMIGSLGLSSLESNRVDSFKKDLLKAGGVKVPAKDDKKPAAEKKGVEDKTADKKKTEEGSPQK